MIDSSMQMVLKGFPRQVYNGCPVAMPHHLNNDSSLVDSTEADPLILKTHSGEKSSDSLLRMDLDVHGRARGIQLKANDGCQTIWIMILPHGPRQFW